MSRKTRKLIWSAPLVAVLAVAGALAMFAAQGPGSVFANPLPGVPMNVEVNPASGNAGRTTLVVTWDEVADAAGYRIDVSDDSFVWETRVGKDSPHTSTTYTDNTELTASDVRWYRVFAVNSHGEGPVSDPADGMTRVKGKPGPVRNFEATAMGQRQINLTWDPPADNGGEKISGYEIQFHDGANWVGLVQTEADRIAANFLVVTEKKRMDDGGFQDKDTTDFSLDPGEMRRYQIRAVNNDDPTTGVTADDRTDEKAPGTAGGWVRADATTAVATPPTPPSGLTAVNTTTTADATEGGIALHWFAPELMDNGGWPVTDYLVQVRRVGEDWMDLPDATALAALTDTGQTAGTIPDDGNAQFKIPLASTYTATQMSFAAVPNTWDHDGDGGGATPTAEVPLSLQFRVFAITTDDGVDDDAAAETDNMLIIGTKSSEISATVRTVTRPTSDADNDDTNADADPYGAPTLAATGGSAGEAPATDGAAKEKLIELTIARPTGVGTQNVYRIDYSDNGGETWKLQTGRTTFTGFDGNRRYQDHTVGFDASRTYRAFTLRSDWRTTAGPVSNAPTGTTTASVVPGKVTGVMASSPDLETIMASWTAPEKDGGQPIVKYQYQYVLDDGDDVAEESDFDASTNANPLVTADPDINTTDDASLMAEIEAMLEDDELYHIRVRAVNKEAGTRTDATNTTEGPWSDIASFTTGEATAPNMVEGIASEMAKDGTGTRTQRGVDILWNKPSGDIAVDHYVVERSTDMGTTWETLADDEDDAPASRTAYTDPRHYEEGETLVYRVQAMNDAGKSEPVKVYYPRDPAAHTDHALGVASGLTGTVSSDGNSVMLEWTPGPNSNIHWVAAARRADGGGIDTGTGSTVWAMADEAASHTVDVSNLNAGDYLFTVIAGHYNAATDVTTWSLAWTSFAEVTVP